ncbi:hypothetical protein [Aeromicrobium sp. UC242_57]|uniref:hypothetical protein n=1 Tax=Aeromicrobium sp. UC242_57 TaxID=3374624 RepID=UPI0037AB13FB
MFREMMSQVLTRLPDYRVIDDGLVAYPTSGNQAGFDAIPAIFTPGRRSAGGLAERDRPVLPRQLVISAATPLSGDVLGISLRSEDGSALPVWRPGAHVERRSPQAACVSTRCAEILTTPASGRSACCGNPQDGADRRSPRAAAPGTRLTLRGLRNHFGLVDAARYLFIAGGIGVTPILAMARDAADRGIEFTVSYGGRSRSTMAFVDELSHVAGDRLTLLPQDEVGLPDLAALLASVDPDTAVYACGPAAMLTALREQADVLGMADQRTSSTSRPTTTSTSTSIRQRTPSSRCSSRAPGRP